MGETSPHRPDDSPPPSVASASSDASVDVERELIQNIATPAPVPNETTSLLPKRGTGEDDEDDDGPRVKGVKLHYIVPALTLGVFMVAMDVTIVLSQYGKIGSELKELSRTSWIATSYMLTTTAFQPLYGRLSEIFGRKSALLFAYAVFGLGCLGCGLARSMGELIAARAFAGIGGGGMNTVVSILLSDMVSLRRRGTFQGIINIVWATGSAIGAPLGGILADSIGWRWAFLIQVPASFLAFIVVSAVLHLPPLPGVPESMLARLKRVDFGGAIVLIIAVAGLCVGLDIGGNSGFDQPIVIAALSVAAAFFPLFVFIESNIAIAPFAPPHVVGNRTIFAACMANFFAFGGYIGVLFYVPLYFQVVKNMTAGQAGVRLLPQIVGGVTGSLTGGLVMQKTGRYFWLTFWAYAVFAAGAVPVLLTAGKANVDEAGIMLGITAMGFGNGIGVTTTLIALIHAAGAVDQAVATAVSYLFRSLGTVAGVSIASSLVQGTLRKLLAAKLTGDDAAEIVERVRDSLEYIKTLEPEVREIVVRCYAEATKTAFLFGLAVAVFAVISSAWIGERRLSH